MKEEVQNFAFEVPDTQCLWICYLTHTRTHTHADETLSLSAAESAYLNDTQEKSVHAHK